MEHIDEKILELYVLRANEVEGQRSVIEEHLRECAGCAALHKEMMGYYQEVIDIRGERADEQSQALTLRSLIVKLPSSDSSSTARIPGTLPARVVLFVIRHPLVSSMSLIAAFLAGLLVMAPKTVPKDVNPSYARPKDEFLVVYNNHGDELWRKHIGFGYDVKGGGYDPDHPERTVALTDVDGDGKNEVISIFGWTNARLPSSNTIICYNSDGSERWKYEFHRQIAFGKTQYSDDYKFTQLLIGDFDRDGKIEVVAVASHVPWIPNAVARLNANDGTLLAEYWQAGKIESFAHRVIDADNVEELFFAGKNSGFTRASLIVLDPRKMTGHAPLPEKDIPQGIEAGTEKYYVLFPASDLEKFWAEQNQADRVTISSDGTIEVNVVEQIRGREGGQLHYFFDSSLRCIKVLGSNGFLAAHESLEMEGKLTRKIDDKYYDELRKGVLYWDGGKFVNEPAMNRHYLEAMKKGFLP